MFEIKNDGKSLLFNGRTLPFPTLSVGRGHSDIKMYRGNFKIKENPIKWNHLNADVLGDCVIYRGEDIEVKFLVEERGGFLFIKPSVIEKSSTTKTTQQNDSTTQTASQARTQVDATQGTANYNRFRLEFVASEAEAVYGGGEQYSYFNLRGHKIPVMTTEQGVGRNPLRPLTIVAQLHDKAGGSKVTTYYPQSTFVSSISTSDNYMVHIYGTDYCVMDFTSQNSHKVISYSLPPMIAMAYGDSLMDCATKVSLLLGRQQVLPKWVHQGIILGLQGGTETVKGKVDKALASGVKVCGLWIQDWSGKIQTSFGSRVLWDWVWDSVRYPDLPTWTRQLAQTGIRVLAYINPYVIKNGTLAREAAAKGYLVKDPSGNDYFIDFGEFECAHIDLTNTQAFDWYKQKIKQNLLDIGITGWMTDFGEYLPTDAVVHSRISGTQAHNLWPGLWAKLNHEVLEETNNMDNAVFFMRSGNSLSPRYAQSIWAGDQNVDWSRDDGIASVIPAALSLAYSGYGLSFSDIGGYTTIAWLHRSKELLLRWTELSCFTPIMRTHQGNRPSSNWQFDSDSDTLSHIAYWSNLHSRLTDYLIFCEEQNRDLGLAVMRPMNWYTSESWAKDCVSQYMLGPDLLVAPILEKGAHGRHVNLPDYVPTNVSTKSGASTATEAPSNDSASTVTEAKLTTAGGGIAENNGPVGTWTHLFTGQIYSSGLHYISSKIEEHSIPVFYRTTSPWASYFANLTK